MLWNSFDDGSPSAPERAAAKARIKLDQRTERWFDILDFISDDEVAFVPVKGYQYTNNKGFERWDEDHSPLGRWEIFNATLEEKVRDCELFPMSIVALERLHETSCPEKGELAVLLMDGDRIVMENVLYSCDRVEGSLVVETTPVEDIQELVYSTMVGGDKYAVKFGSTMFYEEHMVPTTPTVESWLKPSSTNEPATAAEVEEYSHSNTEAVSNPFADLLK